MPAPRRALPSALAEFSEGRVEPRQLPAERLHRPAARLAPLALADVAPRQQQLAQPRAAESGGAAAQSMPTRAKLPASDAAAQTTPFMICLVSLRKPPMRSAGNPSPAPSAQRGGRPWIDELGLSAEAQITEIGVAWRKLIALRQ